MRLSVFFAALVLLFPPCFAQEIMVGGRQFFIPLPPNAELFQQLPPDDGNVSSFVMFNGNNQKMIIAKINYVSEIREDASYDTRKAMINDLKQAYDEVNRKNTNVINYDIQIDDKPLDDQPFLMIFTRTLFKENYGKRSFVARLDFFIDYIWVNMSIADLDLSVDSVEIEWATNFLFNWGAEIYVANDPKNFPSSPSQKTAPVEADISTGSGFFISPNGIIVTNYHVIENATEITVKDTFTGKITKAQVIKEDPTNDIAILKVKESDHPYLSFYNGSTPRKGEDIISLGYPLVSLQGQEQKATFGKINSQSGADGDIRFFQVDAPIQPGNSGGPLLNSHGEVIGINTQTANASFMLVEKGIIPQNINYAIKIDYAIPAARDALAEYDMKISFGSGSTYSSVADVVAATEKAVSLIIVK